MEARDITEQLKDEVEAGIALSAIDGYDGIEVSWGHGDSDFFITIPDEGTFLVTVSKVSE
jgi:hypothetical protein